jgi:hypothetical protein
MTTRKEVMTMKSYTDMQMQVARERIGRYRKEADSARRVRRTRQPFRRTIGQTIIRIGERMAAEPTFRPARTP